MTTCISLFAFHLGLFVRSFVWFVCLFVYFSVCVISFFLCSVVCSSVCLLFVSCSFIPLSSVCLFLSLFVFVDYLDLFYFILISFYLFIYFRFKPASGSAPCTNCPPYSSTMGTGATMQM